jgi:hypothetical protein
VGLFTWLQVLLPVLVAQVIVSRALLTQPLVGMSVDEALHALYAAGVLHSLSHADLRNVALDILDQVRWPPLGSIIQLPTLMLLGTSEAAHRLAILVWLLPTAACLAVAAMALPDTLHTRLLAATIAVGLLITSHTAVMASSSVLYEVPGVGAAIATYWLAHRAWTGRRPTYLLLAGWMLVATWFIKWQYGIVATLALMISSIAHRGWESKMARRRSFAWLFGPSIALLILWLAWPYHLREFLLYLLWLPASMEKGASNVAAACRWFLHGSLLAQVLSVVSLGGIVLALPLVRKPLALVLVTHLVLAAAGSLPKGFSMRTALWIAMPAWALAGAGWGCVAERWLSRSAAMVAVWLLTALAIAGGVAVGTRVATELSDGAMTKGIWYREEAKFVAQTTPFGARLLTVGGWRRHISPFHIKRHMLALHWNRRFSLRDLPVDNWPSCEWKWWQLYWPSPKAVLSLRRPAPRPERVKSPPDYVAAMYLAGDGGEVDAQMDEVRKTFRLKPLLQRTFANGSRVMMYRCLGGVGSAPPGRQGKTPPATGGGRN